MRKIYFLLTVAATLACVTGPDQENRRCPCSPGWICLQQRCVKEAVVCPGRCGDGIQCPGEACDDGDTSDCTATCNATCTGAARPNNPVCVEPKVFFAESRMDVVELPPTSTTVSETYDIPVYSSNLFHSDVTITFGISNDLNEDTVSITPASGRLTISAGETVSNPISVELFRDAADGMRRTVYLALLSCEPGEVGTPSLFSLWVRNTKVPEVVRTVPEPDTIMVPVDTILEMEFSIPMDRYATSAALSIAPPVDGALIWYDGDQRVVFTPTDPLAAGETYVVTLSSEAMSQEGVAPFEYGFFFVTWGSLDTAIVMSVLAPLL